MSQCFQSKGWTLPGTVVGRKEERVDGFDNKSADSSAEWASSEGRCKTEDGLSRVRVVSYARQGVWGLARFIDKYGGEE